MKKISRITSALLCLMLLASLVTVSAAGNTASLRIEGTEKNLLHLTGLEFEAGTTVYDLLTSTLDAQKIAYDVSKGYISQIAGESEGTFGGWDGWMFYVNGKEAAAGMKDTVLTAGDEILVCYSDAYGTPPTLLATLSPSRSADGLVQLALTAQVTQFDEEGNASVVTVPAAGVTVTVGAASYVSDDAGKITLSAADSALASAPVQIEKKTEDGKPLVIRFAPDYTLELAAVKYIPKFTDVTPGAWYEGFVYELVGMGAIKGYDDGTFKPTKAVTRAEFVKILAFVGGANTVEFKANFADVGEKDWHAAAITWAAENDIIDVQQERFYPNNNLTREDMAVMLARFNVNILKKPLPQDKPAPTFIDEADISPNAAESIYLMQRAGILEGDTNGAFSPKGTAQRSAAAKVISLLLNIA